MIGPAVPLRSLGDPGATMRRHPHQGFPKRFAGAPLLLLLLLPLAARPSAAVRQARIPDPMAPGLSGAERLQALLERVKMQQRQIRTIEARFVQHRVSAMLVAPEKSTGTFSYAAPDRVRW